MPKRRKPQIPNFAGERQLQKIKATEAPPLALSEGLFDLAPLSRTEPAKVVASVDDQLGGFILLCAHIFNDLKDLLLFRQAINVHPPRSGEANAHNGQWYGLSNHVDRMIMSVLHETLVAFAEQIKIANGTAIQAYLHGAPSHIRKAWKRVVDTASGATADDEDSAFKLTVLKIRNAVAYHYYRPKKLLQGYHAHFFDAPKSAHNEAAYSSLGRNMEMSRFYFADAAAERAVDLLAGEMSREAFSLRLKEFASATNEVLMYVIRRHLERQT